jgi:hypothetical protein
MRASGASGGLDRARHHRNSTGETLMRFVYGLFIVLALGGLAAGPASAEGPGGDKAINIALFNPVQIFNESHSVTGFRWNIFYGKNADFTGFDLGWVALGQVTGDMTGVQWNPINLVGGMSTGWQAGLVNVTHGYLGLQTAAVNYDEGTSEGAQLGWVNIAQRTSGLQIGLFNMTQQMDSGLQIGIINVIQSKEKLPILPLVNWSF